MKGCWDLWCAKLNLASSTQYSAISIQPLSGLQEQRPLQHRGKDLPEEKQRGLRGSRRAHEPRKSAFVKRIQILRFLRSYRGPQQARFWLVGVIVCVSKVFVVVRECFRAEC